MVAYIVVGPKMTWSDFLFNQKIMSYRCA